MAGRWWLCKIRGGRRANWATIEAENVYVEGVEDGADTPERLDSGKAGSDLMYCTIQRPSWPERA